MSPASCEAVITRFYSAFARRDADTMAACYASDAQFRDPVFTLRGAQIGRMWKMLCTRGADLRIEFANVISLDRASVDNTSDTTGFDAYGSADWRAWYTFSGTGRAVHNVIHAQFRFSGELIVEHIDNFGFWRWSRQALGTPGVLLGWTPLLKAKVRQQAARALDAFESSNSRG